MATTSNNIPNSAVIIPVNSVNKQYALTLPIVQYVYGKSITIKDVGNNASNNPISIYPNSNPITTIYDTIENGLYTYINPYLINQNLGYVTLFARSNTWNILANSKLQSVSGGGGDSGGDSGGGSGGFGISSLSSIVSYGLSSIYSPIGLSSLSSIVSYGLSSLGASGSFGISSLSSIMSYGLSSVYSPLGISSLSSIISYGLSSIYSPLGISSLSSIVSYGLSSVYSPLGISSLSSIISYGLSSVYSPLGISSLSSIVSYGLSSLRSPLGISSLSSIVSYGLSSVYSPLGISSLSSIISYGLSSVYSPFGLSSLSSIVSYGLSSLRSPLGLSSLSSIVSYGLSSVYSPIGLSSLSSIISYGLSTVSLQYMANADIAYAVQSLNNATNNVLAALTTIIENSNISSDASILAVSYSNIASNAASSAVSNSNVASNAAFQAISFRDAASAANSAALEYKNTAQVYAEGTLTYSNLASNAYSNTVFYQNSAQASAATALGFANPTNPTFANINATSNLTVSGNTNLSGNSTFGGNGRVLLISEIGDLEYFTNGSLFSTNLKTALANANDVVTDVQYNGTIAVATTSNFPLGAPTGGIYYSKDLLNWSPGILPSPAPNAANKIVFSNNTVVVASKYNSGYTITYSYDGIFYTTNTNGNIPTGALSIAFGNNMWMIANDTNGATTTSINKLLSVSVGMGNITSGGFNTRANYIYYNSTCNIWIALGQTTGLGNPNPSRIQFTVGPGATVNFSNASNTTPGRLATHSNIFFPNGFGSSTNAASLGATSVDYGNGRFIVVGDDGSATNGATAGKSNMYVSTDGRNFQCLVNNLVGVRLWDIKYFASNTWFTISRNSALLYRSDDNGTTWSSQNLNAIPQRLTVVNTNIYNTAISGNTTINTGGYSLNINGIANIGSNSNLIIATVGVPTSTNKPIQVLNTSVNIFNPTLTTFTDITTNGSMWVAVGNTGFAYSYDAANWYTSSNPSLASVSYSVSYGDQWIAVASNTAANPPQGKIFYSSDGILWKSNVNTFNATYAFTGAKYNGSYWLLLGGVSATTSNIYYSTNPATNSPGTLRNVITGGFNSVNAVEWNNIMWVATGTASAPRSNVQYSYDGLNWTNTNINFSVVGNGVAYGNGVWVVGGVDTGPTNRIYYSSNGAFFYPSVVPTPASNVFDIRFIQNGVVGTFYALYGNKSYITSINGSDWTISPNTFNYTSQSGLALGYYGQTGLSVAGKTQTTSLQVDGPTTHTGNTLISGNLNVGGTTNFKQAVSMNDSLTVGGALNLNSGLSIGATLNLNSGITFGGNQIRYFTFNVISPNPTSPYVPQSGIIYDRGYSFTSSLWILTLVGYNIDQFTKAIYLSVSGSIWNYNILSGITTNMNLYIIAYPINCIFNAGTTTCNV